MDEKFMDELRRLQTQEEEEEGNEVPPSEEITESTGQPQVSETFKDNLREWLDLAKNIEEVNKELKEVRKRKSDLEEVIKNSMRGYKVKALNIPGAKITLKTSKVVKPLKREDIQSLIGDLLGSEKAAEIVEYVYSKRTYVETERLGKTKRS